MELTASLYDLGHWSVYMALKSVSPFHPDCTTKVFLEKGPEPTSPVSPYEAPHRACREHEMSLRVPRGVYMLVGSSRIDPRRRDYATSPS